MKRVWLQYYYNIAQRTAITFLQLKQFWPLNIFLKLVSDLVSYMLGCLPDIIYVVDLLQSPKLSKNNSKVIVCNYCN